MELVKAQHEKAIKILTDNRAKLDELAEKYNVTNTAIALAWILRHPAKMQAVTGTINPKRLRDCAAALDITLAREDWYALYLAAGYRLP